MLLRRVLPCVIAAVMGLSCAPRRADTGTQTAGASPGVLLRTVSEIRTRVHTVVGRGNLSFDSPEAAGSAFFRLALARPESLLVRLQGPFGLNVGTFFLTRKKFLLYNAVENSVITGRADARNIRSVVPFDLTGDDVFNLFGGAFPLPADTMGLRSAVPEDGQMHLTFGCGSEQCEYWVDQDDLLVTKLRRTNSAGEVVAEASAGDVRDYEGIAVPRRIRLAFPKESRTISVYYTALSVNRDRPSFEYSIPAGARSITR
jgi:hypothetical protein